jgi:hypothetical protein
VTQVNPINLAGDTVIRKSCVRSLSYGDTFGDHGVKFVAPNPFKVTGRRTAFFLCPRCNKEFDNIPYLVLKGKIKSCCRYKRGHVNLRIKEIWAGMKARVFNPKRKSYANYGGRGITVCDAWLDFYNFQEWALRSGYRDDLTLDRVDNDSGYTPKNCRWATWSLQGQNKRSTVWWTVDGKKMTMLGAANYLKIPNGTVQMWSRGKTRVPQHIYDRITSITRRGEELLPTLKIRPIDYRVQKPCL